jgi:hypothetical protein
MRSSWQDGTAKQAYIFVRRRRIAQRGSLADDRAKYRSYSATFHAAFKG